MAMRTKLAFAIVSVTIAVALGACTIGQTAPSADPKDVAATIVAATLKAAGISTSPAASDTPNAPATVPAPTITATAKPELKISANGVACRTGPGANDEILTTFGAGTTVDMIAQDSADGYWMVKDPASGSSCWVRQQEATAGGDYTLLPEVTPQAIESKTTPAKPGSSADFNYWEYNCGGGTVSLRWLDNADNETGYRIYRNSQMIAELAAGSTSYTDAIYLGIGPLGYSIRATNDAGESAPLNTPSFSC
jgi:hypothetical protein